MAAGTQTLTTANKKAFWRKIKQATNYSYNVPLDPGGLFAFDSGSQTVAATNTETQDDELFVLQFPDGAYLVDLQVEFSDLDTGANLIVDTIVETSGGTETVLITGTNPQSAVKDELDANAGHLLRDVGGQYLGFKVTTGAAGGAQAGTVRYKGLIWIGTPLTGF